MTRPHGRSAVAGRLAAVAAPARHRRGKASACSGDLERAIRWFNKTGTRASAGYTLIELLVVLTIISLIMGLIGPRVLSYLGESKVKTAKLQIESFTSSLDLFYLDAGRYPSTVEGLNALVERPHDVELWNGPYLKGGRTPLDPWGHPYQYRVVIDRSPPYEIVSFGSDGREGGTGAAADISNVEP